MLLAVTVLVSLTLSSCEKLFTEAVLTDTETLSFSIVSAGGEPLPAGAVVLTTLSGTEHTLLELRNAAGTWTVSHEGELRLSGDTGFIGGIAVLPDGTRMYCESGSYKVSGGKVHVKMVFAE